LSSGSSLVALFCTSTATQLTTIL